MFAERNQQIVTFQETLSADATRAIARAAGTSLVTAVDVYNSTNLATHATNYVTFKLINLGTDAQGTTVIATASTSQTTGAAMAANVAFPLTITAANKSVADGETIGFIYDESTTDVANSQVINVTVKLLPVGAPSVQ
jgi:hypothetical protein